MNVCRWLSPGRWRNQAKDVKGKQAKTMKEENQERKKSQNKRAIEHTCEKAREVNYFKHENPQEFKNAPLAHVYINTF